MFMREQLIKQHFNYGQVAGVFHPELERIAGMILGKKIPIMRPLLPSFEKIAPYLKQIDANRWYSNFGPLTLALEERLAKHFGISKDCMVTCNSATSGITLSLLAYELPKKSFCLVPSFTFTASAAAILDAGLTPYFIDVDEEQMAITPEIALNAVREIGSNISSVLVVAPFGSSLDMNLWANFSEKTGIKVIVDAASCFDAFATSQEAKANQIPIVISLHATKPFGVGEGGIVYSLDAKLMDKVRKLTNFGFGENRISNSIGLNAKISEYTAAIGNAELDGWNGKKEAWLNLKLQFTQNLKGYNVWGAQNNFATSTLNVILEKDGDKDVADSSIILLEKQGIEARKWWHSGCHKMPAYNHLPKLELSTTEDLCKRVLGLPFWLGVGEGGINFISRSL
jgi:dTDP-4-amino-4,6-dideoxygalactose transaminase